MFLGALFHFKTTCIEQKAIPCDFLYFLKSHVFSYQIKPQKLQITKFEMWPKNLPYDPTFEPFQSSVHRVVFVLQKFHKILLICVEKIKQKHSAENLK
jgi:hypothetical protein